jgi:uncharacterized protein YoxC
MNLEQVLMLGAFIAQLAVMLGASIWFVVSVKVTTAELRGTIDHLSKTIETLGNTINRIEMKQHDHELRFARMEREQ